MKGGGHVNRLRLTATILARVRRLHGRGPTQSLKLTYQQMGGVMPS